MPAPCPLPKWHPAAAHHQHLLGQEKERLTITFAGTETVRIDNRSYDTYHIKFRFTTDGGKQSSDDIDTWVETAAPHRPVKLEGKLKIGKIMCLLEP